jgi:hypothetical protein
VCGWCSCREDSEMNPPACSLPSATPTSASTDGIMPTHLATCLATNSWTQGWHDGSIGRKIRVPETKKNLLILVER